MKKSAIIISLILAFLFFPKYIFAAQSGLIINEIMYDLPGTDGKHEWVELYNASNADIDLAGAKFNDGDNATNHGLNEPGKNGSRGQQTLPSGGYLLLAGDAEQLAADLANYQGPIIDTVMSLNNTAATLRILDKDGNELAAVAYTKEMGAAGNGKTLARSGAEYKESAADGGTPGAENIAASFSPSPTPSANPDNSTRDSDDESSDESTANDSDQNAYDFSQDIYLNEFLPSPAKGQKEWVELFNAGDKTVNLTGWQIDDAQNSTKPQAIPDDTKINPDEFLVIELPRNILNNDGDTARLLWPDDQIVHSVSYQKAKQNVSYARFSNGWLATNQPTPGGLNKKSTQQNNMVSAAQAANEKDEIVLAGAPTIQTRQDAVLVDSAGATGQTQIFRSPTSENSAAQSAPDNPNLPNSPNIPDNNPQAAPNLSADISGAADGSGIKTILVLSVIIIFSGLCAAGLVYFRRRQLETINQKK